MQTIDTIQKLVSEISFRHWNLFVHNEDRPYLQWVWKEEDPVNGGIFHCAGRKWMLSYYMTDSEIVQTAFLAAQTAVNHETREFFKFQNRPVMRPHFDVYELVKLCDEGAVSKRKG